MELTIKLKDTDKQIMQQIQLEAENRNISLSDFVLQLLQSGLNLLLKQNQQTAYHDLDALAGTWSSEEGKLFEQNIADFGQIDEALWV